jgi:hypothetical protein
MYGLQNTDFKHRLQKEKAQVYRHGLTLDERHEFKHQITIGTMGTND